MGEVEKPFSCPEQNCNMTFTNEDHLQVHKRRHEESMKNQTGFQCSFIKNTGFIIDQTPTPTKFLKQCDEVSLFQEINLNPFDLEFRKAQYRTQISVSESQGANIESLDTPRIVPLVDSDETISSTSRDDINISTSSIGLCPNIQDNFTSNNVKISSLSPRIIEFVTEDKREGRKKLTLNVATAAEAKEGSNVISTPTPVITAGPSVSQALISVNCSTSTLNTPTFLTTTIPQINFNGGLSSNELSTPTISPAIRFSSTPTSVLQHSSYFEPIESQTTNESDNQNSESQNLSVVMTTGSTPQVSRNIVTSSQSATVLQLVLRLPNGQSIPVEIPATPVVSSVNSKPSVGPSMLTSIAPAFQTSAQTTVINSATVPASLTKMKLKEALASSSTAARPGSMMHSRASTADRIAEMTRSRNQSGTSSNGVNDLQDDSSSSCSSGTGITQLNNVKPGIRRRRNTSCEETPEEKRMKFLARNRAAAVRCREKKKKLVQHIAAKSDELSLLNQKLQAEVASLRTEVASLKCLLLRHKNCPVTLAMKGHNEGSEFKDQPPQTFTTFKVQDPAGIITEVTTPVTCDSNKIIITQPSYTVNYSHKNQTIMEDNDKLKTDDKFKNPPQLDDSRSWLIPRKVITNNKLRKRSLSLSAISPDVNYLEKMDASKATHTVDKFTSETSQQKMLTPPKMILPNQSSSESNVLNVASNISSNNIIQITPNTEKNARNNATVVARMDPILSNSVTTASNVPSSSILGSNLIILAPTDGSQKQVTGVLTYRQPPIIYKYKTGEENYVAPKDPIAPIQMMAVTKRINQPTTNSK